MADVTQTAPGLRTPRMVMQVCIGLDHHRHALGVQLLDQQIGDLLGHAFLDLGPAGDVLDHPGQLAQPDYPLARQVGHVGRAHERQHVVLAHAVETDVADQHDLVARFGEELSQVAARILVQAAEQLGIHAGHSGRGLAQALAVGVFAHRRQNLPHRTLDPQLVDRAFHQAVQIVVHLAIQAAGDRFVQIRDY